MNAGQLFKKEIAKLLGMLRKRGSRREEAEDLVQEAFVRLLTYIEQGGKVVQPEAFLAKAVFNLAVDRKRREHGELYESRRVDELALPAIERSVDDLAADEQCLRRTAKLLDEAVGKRARYVFFLHCFEGLTYAEIARRIDKSVLTVERDLTKAISVLTLQELERQ